MVSRPRSLSGNSKWGKHVSLGQRQGGSGVPVSDPRQKAGGARCVYLDPWLVATCTEVPFLSSRKSHELEKTVEVLEVSCEGNKFTKIRA